MSFVNTWQEEGLGWVELNRPDKLNALNREVLTELRAALLAQCDSPATRVIILTGAGERAFAAGADIAEMHAESPEGIRSLMELGKEVALILEEAGQPVIAAVNGFALGGGCELSLACDLVCAVEHAQFGLPEVDLGVLPGWGGSQRLERRIGYGRARDMVLTGRRVPAPEALTWGLCDRIFPAATFRQNVTELGRILAAKDPDAVSTAKRALRARSMLSQAEGLNLETQLFVDLFDRPEREQRMGLFIRR